MKIRFENFGNIKEGEIELKPLTVFIGPNNTGKTYCAYSIYGILDYEIIGQVVEKIKIEELDNDLNNIINELKEKGHVKINIEEILRKYLNEILNKVCEIFSKELLHKFMQTKKKELFNNTNISPILDDESIENIIRRYLENEIKSKFGKGEDNTVLEIIKDKKNNDIVIYSSIKNKEDEKFLNMMLNSGRIKEILLLNLIFGIFLGIRNNVFVLPSERIALVSLYRYLGKKGNKLIKAISAISEDFEEDEAKELIKNLMFLSYRYPKPIKDFIDFLDNLDDISKKFDEDEELRNKRKKFIEIAELIEKEILGGKIKLVKYEEIAPPILEFEFEDGKSIEMHLTSSMVKELTGLVLYFKYLAHENDLLIIDEPEMNLHPEAQVKLLEILTMAVNRGLKILITTHSPYITDHLTNLMECYVVKDKIKDEDLRNYLFTGQKEAIISSDKVAVYFFSEDGIIKDILDRKETLIDWETFSKVSERLGKIYDNLLELEFRDKENWDKYADE